MSMILRLNAVAPWPAASKDLSNVVKDASKASLERLAEKGVVQSREAYDRAGCLDAVVEHSELRADLELLDLVFDEKLCRLSECLLNLTDADDAATGLSR
jgi:hypothetical protein